MQVVFDRLKQMDIPPEGEDMLKEDSELEARMISEGLAPSVPSGTAPQLTPLVEKVIRLAAELRKEWVEEEDESPRNKQEWENNRELAGSEAKVLREGIHPGQEVREQPNHDYLKASERQLAGDG
ncbi:hypothetical protein [Moorella sp. Hama-1]|uniref:hypothetical protein n=1 Tax=Moorella sp. Hama-1 TaxID=2138101 RepID=UPI00128FD383|nr:hypothetical protein [Moorella sp. Hama-1]BCV22761.1 hypothetical protein hamaS1_28300 [Moorella sp. Hama-1]